MHKVYIVYRSDLDSCEGLGGGGCWEEPKMITAFTTKEKARNWIKRQKIKYKNDWRVRFSYKTHKVF